MAKRGMQLASCGGEEEQGFSPNFPGLVVRSSLIYMVGGDCPPGRKKAFGNAVIDAITSCIGYITDRQHLQVESAVVDAANIPIAEGTSEKDMIHNEGVIDSLEFGDICVVEADLARN